MSKKVGKLLLLIGSLVLLYLMYRFFLKGITAAGIRDWVQGFGSLAPVAYILVWVVLPVFFFPVPVLALAGGLSFGLVQGSIYTMIGAVLNSSLMFWLANLLAKDMVKGYLEKKMPEKWWKRFMRMGKRDGFFVVFICRLIPAMPYNVINYASGLTEISFWSYSLATVLGIIPGTVIFLNVGDKILDVKSPEFIWSMVLVVLLTVFSIMLGKYVSKRSDQKELERQAEKE